MYFLSFKRNIPRDWVKIARDQKRKLEMVEDQQIMQIVSCKKSCNYVYNKLLCQTYVNRKYAAKWQDNMILQAKLNQTLRQYGSISIKNRRMLSVYQTYRKVLLGVR